MPSIPRYLVALVTPFDRAGDLDLEAHRHNVRVLSARGIEGFVIGGSNGEGPYLEPDERRMLAAATRAELDRGHVMSGVMAETVREARRQLDEIADGGADTGLVLTPTTLARGRTDAVEGFFTQVADASPLPVLLYSVPNTTAYNLPEEAVARLAAHPRTVGMKDSSGDPVRLQRIVQSTPDDFLLWSGSSQALTLSVAAGAHGAITGSGNYVPDLVLDTLSTALDDPWKARGPQARLSTVSRLVERHGIPGVKAASEAAGLRPGHPRLPLTPVTREVAEELRTAVGAI